MVYYCKYFDLHKYEGTKIFKVLRTSMWHIPALLPAKTPRIYSFAVSSRIALWQYLFNHRPLNSIKKEKWQARAGAQTRDP